MEITYEDLINLSKSIYHSKRASVDKQATIEQVRIEPTWKSFYGFKDILVLNYTTVQKFKLDGTVKES